MGKAVNNTICHCLKMRRSAENVIRFYDSYLLPLGITVRQYSFLNAIMHHDSCTVTELAKLTLLDRSTLSRNIKPLIKRGFIEDIKNIGSRNSILTLSEEGKILCNKATLLWEEAQKEYEEILGKEKLEALEDALEVLQRL